MISLRGCSSPSASASMASGISAATPLGPSGSPMSVEVNTSRDSLPSAWPSCEPNAMPPICDIIASSGPAMPWPPRAAPTPTPWRSVRPPGRTAASRCPACCRPSRSASTPPTWWCPRAAAVTPSSHVSASRTASAMARAGLLGHRLDEADRAGRQLAGQVVVDRARLLAAAHHVAGAAEHLAELGEDLTRGRTCRSPAAAESERIRRRPESGSFLRLVAVGVVSRGRSRRAGQPCFNGTHRAAGVRRRGSR